MAEALLVTLVPAAELDRGHHGEGRHHDVDAARHGRQPQQEGVASLPWSELSELSENPVVIHVSSSQHHGCSETKGRDKTRLN